MTKKHITYCILSASLLAIGYFLGAWMHPRISEWMAKREQPEMQIEKLFGEGIADLRSGMKVDLDTLASHEKNLLVFWSPTCEFCKKFFQNNMNSSAIGIFCFPITDDMEYTEYYLDRHSIPYPQLISTDSTVQHAVDAQFISAVPTFYVVNSHGETLMKHQGINDIDNFIDSLYNH